ncbi:E3 ubiquitin-protein ligase At1g12760-like isoform X1 [Syzygium oleosum]|uniref:E3 ubiquitin-protein ligase At1g12760-like isoform X1 n=1 Tax=Syzygium oleosum TaxID=219896 RepID=UPI0024B8E88D|nr:E3 ubiquitin-protein ligase At1g12760-like isoform X1 [Syzygium oleosum]
MDDPEDPLHGGGGGGDPPLLRRHAPAASSSPSPSRLARLIRTRHRSFLLGDCGDGGGGGGGGGGGSRGDIEEAASSFFGEGLAACSRPIVVLDFVWNLAFVVVAVVVLLSAFKERPSTPLRLWLCGYALQCLFHVGFVCAEYRRRDGDDELVGVSGLSRSPSRSSSLCSLSMFYRMLKRLESLNTLISSVWWVFGFYWIVVGGQPLLQDAPRLYWLTVVFLAFDVFFVIFCIGMAFVVFLALFCCIPILAIAYAVASTEGASEDIIRSLPKYRYRPASVLSTFNNLGMEEVLGARSGLGNNGSSGELFLHSEDSECCICLSSYVDGAELYTLPCNHHFHCSCISKWLLINATCPLCKFNILKGDTLV